MKNPSQQQSKNTVPPKTQVSFWLLLAVLVLATVFVYFKSLNNQFTNWDDNLYITQNAQIQNLNVKQIFSSYVQGNYHPITMLSYGLEYKLFGFNPKPYHVTNLVFHLLNVLLVFAFIWLLTKQRWTAFITALLFAVHPMHVESVAWVSERKDVLYAFFYIGALCMYILYVQQQNNKTLFYGLVFLLFVFSILSKAMAVTLPVVLLLVDYFLDRKITLKIILEKAPFFVLSLVFGGVAIMAQKSSNALDDIAEYNFFDRILFSCYGLLTYLWKLVLPVYQSCFYRYPIKTDGLYPVVFYLAPLLIMAIAYWVYKTKNNRKDWIFGFLFFLITIGMVLQVLPVGAAIVAERYTYIPYIGVFFILARVINRFMEDAFQQSLKTVSLFVLGLFVILFVFLSLQRVKVWRDSITLWSDAIEKDDTFPLPFNSRGDAYFVLENYTKAIPDFSKAIELNYQTPDVYYKRGLAYYHTQQYNEANTDFSVVIVQDDKFPEAYYSRGLARFKAGKNEEAIADYSVEIQRNPSAERLYNDRGVVYDNMGKYAEAVQDYSKAIDLNPAFVKPYLNRGNAHYNKAKYNEAIEDYTQLIRLGSDKAQAYNNRASAYGNLGKYAEAINDYSLAIEQNPQFASAYYNRARVYFNLKKYKEALDDVLKAKQLGLAVDEGFLKQLQ